MLYLNLTKKLKRCSMCYKSKNITNFYPIKNSNKTSSRCKNCTAIKNKEVYLIKKEQIITQHKDYRKKMQQK
jgi:hypothetical protein